MAERQPLGQFLAELARHRPGFLRCSDEAAGLLLTGVFPLADTDRILAALERSLPVRVSYRTRYWVSVQRRA
ncbi:fec operon regulator FecR [compost metagenome]